ncbi:MAG: class I SAM-dependent methyltransferase, partial [Firmicutes bacterium]|nr:class I SAM-dependent methyltransferase [Bacillota bacterium]
MIDFTYPDINDALTVELIRSEYNGAYWGASERRLLTVAKEYISMAFGKDLKSLKHLDLGCGGGRLIPEFAALEGSVTALEPDLTRLEKARELVTGIGLDNVALFNEYSSTFLNKFPESIFDTVLCSHIFQHISHDTAAGILRDLHRMTTEDSVILITTTFADGEENRYTKEYFTDGARVSEPTDRQGFEAAMGCIGTLPVCSFARPYMEQLLKDNGFETVHFGAYHFDDETDALNDAANTLDPARLPHARDAYYIVRKKLPKVSGKVTFSHFFYAEDGVINETLLKADYEDRMTEDQLAVKRDFDICEGFLYGGGLHFEANRYYCGDRKVRVHAHGETFEAAHAHAVITVYPKEA